MSFAMILPTASFGRKSILCELTDRANYMLLCSHLVSGKTRSHARRQNKSRIVLALGLLGQTKTLIPRSPMSGASERFREILEPVPPTFLAAHEGTGRTKLYTKQGKSLQTTLKGSQLSRSIRANFFNQISRSWRSQQQGTSGAIDIPGGSSQPHD